mgnify:CR=1 FL=1
MKPRLFDGEHGATSALAAPKAPAAMKPRLFDGEHGAGGVSRCGGGRGATKPPPLHAGRRRAAYDLDRDIRAAMKPRLFDGEHDTASVPAGLVLAVPQ